MEANKQPQPSFRPMDVVPPPKQKTKNNGPKPDVVATPVQPTKIVEDPVNTNPVNDQSATTSTQPEVSEVAASSGAETSADNEPITVESTQSSEPLPLQAAPADADAELDTIMQEVSTQQSSVKAQSPKAKKPILVIAVTLIVVVGLAVVAYFAFKNTEKTTDSDKTTKTGTPAAKTASGVVTADELGTFAQSTDKQFNDFNDLQDFNVTDVTDAALSL